MMGSLTYNASMEMLIANLSISSDPYTYDFYTHIFVHKKTVLYVLVILKKVPRLLK